MSFRPPMSTQRTRPEWNAREERLRTKGREGSSALVEADVGVVPQEAEAAQWLQVSGLSDLGRKRYSRERQRGPSLRQEDALVKATNGDCPGHSRRPDGYAEAEAESSSYAAYMAFIYSPVLFTFFK